MNESRPTTIIARLPFYYGWVIVGIGFVTMAIGVSVRTSFSLLFVPILDEFGWERGLVAGAFSFGFLVFAVLSPLVGTLMDRWGPRFVVELGVLLLASGMLLAPFIEAPWQLYLTLGMLVGVGANCTSYTAQSLFLPNWFVRRRGLAISIAFSGVGVGALILLPWLQTIIGRDGWRAACVMLGVLTIAVLGPINLFLWRRPQDVGLRPDGERQRETESSEDRPTGIVDPAWAAVDWTLGRAMRTVRFWWIIVGYFCALVIWYVVLVHQTKYLVEVGFGAIEAAWALGLVAVIGIPGQIVFGALSDRFGREWTWTVGCAGFAICYLALMALEHNPSHVLLYVMIVAQGLLGYSLATVMGPIVFEIFEGRHYGAIFGTVNVALIGGGAVGPWAAGVIHDATGSYRLAFILSLACCAVSAGSIWIAAPRKVRLVPGRIR
jgi:MFS family permease